MSALPIPEPNLAPFEPAGNESADIERSRTWYPVNLELEYELWYRRKQVRCGRGRTVRMSSGAVQFEADVALPTGSNVTIDMNWPCLLDGTCALKLQVFGRVLSNLGGQTIVRFIRYEFRTAPVKSTKTAVVPTIHDSRIPRRSIGHQRTVRVIAY